MPQAYLYVVSGTYDVTARMARPRLELGTPRFSGTPRRRRQRRKSLQISRSMIERCDACRRGYQRFQPGLGPRRAVEVLNPGTSCWPGQCRQQRELESRHSGEAEASGTTATAEGHDSGSDRPSSAFGPRRRRGHPCPSRLTAVADPVHFCTRVQTPRRVSWSRQLVVVHHAVCTVRLRGVFRGEVCHQGHRPASFHGCERFDRGDA